MTLLIIALVAFVGSHFLLSHPLRAPLVARLGAGGFAGVYSLVAFATLGWAVAEWRVTPVEPWWTAPTWAWPLAAVIMLFACILFVGSVATPNPALLGMPTASAAAAPRGVQRITRHPMMWAFALWALVHGGLAGSGRTAVLAAAILILALVGAWLQDGKKRQQMGAAWAAHEAATSFVPFGRGFAQGLPTPGWVALIGGIVLFVIATGVHPLAGGPNLWGQL
jgi:uncharacterized membrane protein